MSALGRPPKQRLGSFAAETFLRSISLAFDIDVPERVAHFQPTSKSAILFSSILGHQKSRAFLVIAPYGSGKSITATAAVHLLENRAACLETLNEVSKRWRSVDSSIFRFSEERLASEGASRGLALTLSGFSPDVGSAVISSLHSALSRGAFRKSERFFEKVEGLSFPEKLRALEAYFPRLIDQGVDRIAIVWDEFGRHLDGIVESGETASLDDVQVLAEFAARYAEIPMTFTVLMHQGFFNYAANLPQTSKREWKKIEGRFETIQYVDDSKEIYKLIGNIITAQRRKATRKEELSFGVSAAQNFNLFGTIAHKEIEEILLSCYPLEPFALYLLPRVSARVSQNERTVFSFIFERLAEEAVGPDAIYDYFSESMRADSSLGGTYRQWLETQSALSKASDELEVKVLKTACLLGLGISGERAQCNRAMLAHAVAGFAKASSVEKAISRLLEKKLLLYRKVKDSISIWHGADLDLRGKLDEEKTKQIALFNAVGFINTDFAPMPQKPLRYNAEFSIMRYFNARYIEQSELKRLAKEDPSSFLSGDSDGFIYYIVVNSEEERGASLSIIEGLRKLSSRVVFCLPDKYRNISDAALEVACLKRLSQDHFLLNEDPMIDQELKIMLGDAQSHLSNLLAKAYAPRQGGALWIASGNRQILHNYQHLREFLSVTMEEAYKQTPKISNEMFVRKNLRQNLVNSRRKFIFALLEQYGDPTLGLQGYTPDVSLFRTFMLNTGLYQDQGQGHFAFVNPSKLDDLGMQKVWARIECFFTEPSEQEKSLEQLFEELSSEPYGVRQSLLPVFLAAGYKAFPHAIEIKRNKVYLPDILPSTIEDMCSFPELYSFTVYGLDGAKQEYLRKIISLFSGNSAKRIGEHELLRSAYDSITEWKLRLPPAALEMRLEKDDAKKLQGILRDNPDPYEMFLVQFPSQFAADKQIDGMKDHLVVRLEKAKRLIEDVRIILYEDAANAFAAAFEMDLRDVSDLPKYTKTWIASLPSNIEDTFSDESLKSLFARLRMNYATTDGLLNSIASYLVGNTIDKWGESQVREFRIKLQVVRDSIEEKAMILAGNSSKTQKEMARKLLERRLVKIRQQLLQIGDEVFMREVFSRVSNKEKQ